MLSLAAHAAQVTPGITATASISNSRLTVIDLTPDDGNAAGYTQPRSSYTSLDANKTFPSASINTKNDADTPGFDPVSAAIAYCGSTTASSATTWGSLHTDARLYDSAGDVGFADGNVTQSMFLSIAPHSQLIYSAHGALSIGDAGPYGHAPFAGEAVTTVRFGDQVWIRGMAQGWMGCIDNGVT